MEIKIVEEFNASIFELKIKNLFEEGYELNWDGYKVIPVKDGCLYTAFLIKK